MTERNGYKDLIVWQKAMSVVKDIYILSQHLPKSELFSLTSQLTRSAISIPSNIAEGWGRQSDLEFGRFLKIAYGSSCELETQLILCHDIYPQTKNTKIMSDLSEIQKILSTLIKKYK